MAINPHPESLVMYWRSDISSFDTLLNHMDRKKDRDGETKRWREEGRERESEMAVKTARGNISVLTDLFMHMPPVIALTQQLQPWPSIF